MLRDETLAGSFKTSVPETNEQWLELVRLRVDEDISPLLDEFSLPTLGEVQCIFNDDMSSNLGTKMLRDLKGLACLSPDGGPSFLSLQAQGVFRYVDFLFHDLGVGDSGDIIVWGLTRNKSWIRAKIGIKKIHKEKARYGELFIQKVSIEETLPFAEKIWFGLGDFVKLCHRKQIEKLERVSNIKDRILEDEMLFRIGRINKKDI